MMVPPTIRQLAGITEAVGRHHSPRRRHGGRWPLAAPVSRSRDCNGELPKLVQRQSLRDKSPSSWEALSPSCGRGYCSFVM